MKDFWKETFDSINEVICDQSPYPWTTTDKELRTEAGQSISYDGVKIAMGGSYRSKV